MLSDTNYINAVWSKYDDYCSGKIKDDFFEKRVYREETNENKFLKAVAIFIITVLTMVGVVYAGIAIYNNFKSKSEYINLNNNLISKKWINENMKASKEEADIYYASIQTYDEYLKFKEKFSSLEDLKKEDFENNFVVLICREKIDIENLDVDDNTLYINFKSSSTKEDQNVYTLLVPNEQYRENIKFVRQYDKSEFANIAIEAIPLDYSKEQAIQDGCVVTENNKIISNNEKDIYDFIEKSKNGENCFIRFVVYSKENNTDNNTMQIRDLEYKEGKYIYKLRIMYKDGNQEIKYPKYKFTTLELRENRMGKHLVIKEEGHNSYEMVVFIF